MSHQRAFTCHVGAGNQEEHACAVAEQDIVGHERPRRQRLFQDGMPAFLDGEDRLVAQVRTHILARDGEIETVKEGRGKTPATYKRK